MDYSGGCAPDMSFSFAYYEEISASNYRKGSTLNTANHGRSYGIGQDDKILPPNVSQCTRPG